jgi:hypothetical protein
MPFSSSLALLLSNLRGRFSLQQQEPRPTIDEPPFYSIPISSRELPSHETAHTRLKEDYYIDIGLHLILT